MLCLVVLPVVHTLVIFLFSQVSSVDKCCASLQFNGGFPLKVAAVAKSLDMPDIAKGRPSLSIPGKLVFPR
jgi:hypothetical protein